MANKGDLGETRWTMGVFVPFSPLWLGRISLLLKFMEKEKRNERRRMNPLLWFTEVNRGPPRQFTSRELENLKALELMLKLWIAL